MPAIRRSYSLHRPSLSRALSPRSHCPWPSWLTLAWFSVQNSIDNMTIRTFCNFLHKQLRWSTHHRDGGGAHPDSIIAFGYNCAGRGSAIAIMFPQPDWLPRLNNHCDHSNPKTPANFTPPSPTAISTTPAPSKLANRPLVCSPSSVD